LLVWLLGLYCAFLATPLPITDEQAQAFRAKFKQVGPGTASSHANGILGPAHGGANTHRPSQAGSGVSKAATLLPTLRPATASNAIVCRLRASCRS
jgi:hypothetical protein